MTVSAFIEGLAPDGRGVSSVSGRPLLVRGALPGDQVQAKVSRRRGGRLEGYTVVVESEGFPRRQPPCAHVGQCGGCTWQQWDLAIQREMKQRIVSDAFAVACPHDPVRVLPVCDAGPEYAYRNKMEFTFGRDAKGDVTLGLHRVGRFDATFDIDRCWIAPDGINAVRTWVCDWARRHNLVPYNARAFEGALRHLVLRESAATGEIMANLVATTEDVAGIGDLAENLPKAIPQVKSLLFSLNTRRGDTARAETSTLLSGSETIVERVGTLEVLLSAGSFLQTNSVGAERLYAIVGEMAALTGRERVLDLYCGTGLIGVALAPNAREVVGLEQFPAAVADAVALRARLGLSHVSFVEGEAEHVLPEWAAAGEDFDVAVVDPPRAGLHPKALIALLQLAPRRIVYVSCNPVSLAANARELIAGGYRPGDVQPVDMFPHTPHVESVLRFDR
jgi:23S rRNA (uracil1939-C5)-methyltransferase